MKKNLLIFLIFISSCSSWFFHGKDEAETYNGKFALKSKVNLLVNSNGVMSVTGINNFGELGLGDTTQRDTYQTIEIINNIIEITTNGLDFSHSLVLRNEGKVFASGSNMFGQLGFTGEDSCGGNNCQQTWKQIIGVSNIKAVFTGPYTSFLISKGNILLSSGRNHTGQLGIGDTAQLSEFQINPLEDVIEIKPGAFHSLALTKGGNLYGTGYNKYMQLGQETPGQTCDTYYLGSGDCIKNWKKLEENVIGFGIGLIHTVILKKDGTVWGAGVNNENQLGIASTGTVGGFPCVIKFTKISSLNNIVSVDAGEMSSIALKSDGTVWVVGKNDLGQLGLGDTTSRSSWTKVASLKNIIRIQAGTKNSIALESDGTVWVTGNNANRQLGIDSSILCGDANKCLSWTKVPGINLKE